MVGRGMLLETGLHGVIERLHMVVRRLPYGGSQPRRAVQGEKRQHQQGQHPHEARGCAATFCCGSVRPG